jgi:hypothetical protein
VSGDGGRGLSEAALPIRQFYLAATPGRSVRVRVSGGHSATQTLGEHGRERDEFEYPIPFEEADELAEFALGHVIKKTRHHVSHHGYLYEVDIFGGMSTMRCAMSACESVPASMPSSKATHSSHLRPVAVSKFFVLIGLTMIAIPMPGRHDRMARAL